MILTATEQSVIATFPNKNGTGMSTLYDVRAVDEAGEPITDPLRSFAECPIGKAVEYEVERHEDERHGLSWTLKPPRQNLGHRTEKLESKVRDLEDRILAIEDQIGGSQSL